MILSDKQAQLLRRGTVVIFVATFLAALVSVYGYRFDSSSKSLSLVKKSVVVFDTPVSNYTLSVNKESQNGVRTELRLVPGIYDISLARQNSIEWKKTIDLKEDQLMRLGQPWLLPIKQLMPVDTNLVFEKNWSVVLNSQFWLAYKVENKIFTARFFDRDKNVETRFAIKGFAPKNTFTKIAYDRGVDQVYLLANDSKLMVLDIENLVVVDTKNVARDLIQLADAVAYISDKGVIKTLSSPLHEANGLTLKPPYELTAIKDSQINGDRLALTMTAIDTSIKGKKPVLVELVGLYNLNGEWEVFEPGSLAHFENDEFVYYANGEFTSYNPANKKTAQLGALTGFESPITLRQVGDTFWRVMITKSGQLRVCDAWAENCMNLATTLSTQLMPSNEGFSLNFVDSPKKGTQQIRVVDLDPTNTHERTFTGILTDIIQGTQDSLSNVTSSKATEIEGKPIQ